MEMLFMSGSALAGGLAAGALGWLRSGSPFDGRKFAASFLRAVLAGGATAGLYAGVAPSIEGCIGAFAAGAGVDVIGHRLSKK